MNLNEFIKGNWREVSAATGEHLFIVLVSIVLAIIIGIPLGILVAALRRLVGSITTDEMRLLNYEVDGRRRAIPDVVREWRQREGL
ncbi:MAG TPA: hypothetical protein VGB76_07065 [Pyrinomonadaceae bacterium]|jgi:ABC-type methionine transport system permease subunit